MITDKGNDIRDQWISLVLIFSFTLGYININIGFSLMPHMVLVFILFIYFFRSLKFRGLLPYEFIFFFFFYCYCVSSIFSMYESASLRFILGTNLILIVYIIARAILDKIEIDVIYNAIYVSGIVFNLLSIFTYILGLVKLNFNYVVDNINVYGVMVDRHIPRLIGLTEDPNIFSFYNIFFISFYLYNLEGKRNWFGLILVLITTFLSLSRGGLLAIAIIILLYLFHLKKISKVLKTLVLISAFIGMIMIVFSSVMNINLWETLLQRFSSQDGGSGRLKIWMDCMKYWNESPLVGIGGFNFREYYLHDYGYEKFVHNTFLEILVESGLIGFVLFLLFIFFLVFELLTKLDGEIKKIMLSILIGYIVCWMSLSIIFNEMYYLFLIVLNRTLYDYQKKVEREINPHISINSRFQV